MEKRGVGLNVAAPASGAGVTGCARLVAAAVKALAIVAAELHHRNLPTDTIE
jgi:hypothetical protein